MRHVLVAIVLAAVASVFAAGPAHSLEEPNPPGEPWHHEESVAFADASASGRHVVVVFGATWCLPCRNIEKIMNDETVFGLMSQSFVPLYFDITELSEADEALQAKYHVPALPAVIFVTSAGRELGRWDKKNLSPRGFIAAMQSVVASYPLDSGVSQ
jgi:thiol:disulfide interchange protein